MKILIAMPCSKYIETECVVSLFGVEKIDAEYELYVPKGYSVDMSRNIASRYAVDNNFDYIFWVDTDMILPEDALTKMFSHGKDFVSGVYSYKFIGNKNAVAKRLIDGVYEDISIKEIQESKGIVEVDGVGFGCVLMKVDMLKKIDFPWFIYTEGMGEDIFFCRKAQEKGYKIYLDTDVICGHIGQINYDIVKE